MNCPKCAAQLALGTKVCTACGTVIDSAPVVEVPMPVSAPVSVVAPVPPATPIPPVTVDQGKHAASQWLRLVNYFIDNIAAWVIGAIINSFLLAAPLSLMKTPEEIKNNIGALVAVLIASLLIYPLYYIFFESIWQRTPGKWASGTKVVMLDGSKPSFWRIVGRSFARYIPFEIFSYLFGKYPYGWHDALTKTIVVPDSYSADDIKAINVHEKGKSSVWIWVLAVVALILPIIAILGILSSVILVSLNSARMKGSDASTKMTLSNLRAQGELYFDASGSSYKGFCDSDSMKNASMELARNDSYVGCNDSAKEWAASANLKNEGEWCVDSTGYAEMIGAPLGTATKCAEGVSLSTGEVKWFTYFSPEDGFSIDFPRQPAVTKKTGISLGVGNETMDQFFYEAEDEVNYFMVMKVDYSMSLAEGEPEDLLASMVQGSVSSSVGNKLINMTQTTHNGDPAVEFVMSVSDFGYFKGKYVLTGNQSVYSLLVGYDEGNYDEATYKRFIDSFKK